MDFVKNIAIAVVGFILLAALTVMWQQFEAFRGHGSGEYVRACTEEAKICPDGTSVGRTGANCEFAACPKGTDAADYKNASYIIDGLEALGQLRLVKLVDGVSSISESPDSAAMITTQFFGNEAFGDINGDGLDDVAFLLTQSGSGSGTFYYLVAALKTGMGYHGLNAILLGDRVAPQTIEIRDGIVTLNYAVRKDSEPMTTKPSVGKSLYASFEDETLHEVPKPRGF